jgi:signal transduction histidine kinase
MKKFLLTLALPVLLITGLSAAQAADEKGTSAEAKAMLEKATAELKADKDQALVMFTKREGDFKVKDLYVYCGGEDGNFTAHYKLVGASLKDLKDKSGKAFGEEIYATAQEGDITEVEYQWYRPGSETELVDKVAYVTKVDDQICAVGYYK